MESQPPVKRLSVLNHMLELAYEEKNISNMESIIKELRIMEEDLINNSKTMSTTILSQLKSDVPSDEIRKLHSYLSLYEQLLIYIEIIRDSGNARKMELFNDGHDFDKVTVTTFPGYNTKYLNQLNMTLKSGGHDTIDETISIITSQLMIKKPTPSIKIKLQFPYQDSYADPYKQIMVSMNDLITFFSFNPNITFKKTMNTEYGVSIHDTETKESTVLTIDINNIKTSFKEIISTITRISKIPLPRVSEIHYFSKQFCHHCKQFDEVWDHITVKYETDGIKFHKIDIDNLPDETFSKIRDQMSNALNKVPTLIFKINDLWIEYDGDRKKDSICNYINLLIL